MGRYYLAPFVGAGTRVDPFRPAVDSPHNILDLRGDPTAVGGFCLLWVPDGAVPKGRTVDLGDNSVEALPAQVKRRLGNDLKVDVAAGSVGEIAAELLLTHATPEADKTRPNPLDFRTRIDPNDGVPARYRAIYLGPPGERIWEQYYKGGPGAALSDNWVGLADSDSPDGNNHTWTEANQDWDVVNEEIMAMASGSSELRCDSTLSSANHRSKSTVGTQAGAANTWLDATVRFASGARTYYAFAHQLEQGGRELYKRVGGSYTSITSDSGGVTLSAGDVLECEVDGSDLEGFLNGGSALLTATDTSITGNTQAGLSGFATGGQRIAFSGWEAADLGGGATPVTKDHTADVILQESFSRTHTADAIVGSTSSATHSTDAVVQDTLVVSHTADTHIRGDIPQPSSKDHRAIPEADLHVDTGWRDESSGTSDLWSHINSNQIAKLDQEYAESPDSPSSDVYVFGLSSVPDPGVDENVGAYVPRLRAAKTGDDVSVTWELRQGYVSEASQGTLIHSESTTVDATTPTDYLAYNTSTFEGIDANAITDFSDLSIRVVASAASGRLRIYESNLSVPSTELTWKTDFENFGWTVRTFTADGGEEWYEHRRPFVWNPGGIALHDTGVTEGASSRDLWINGDVSVPGPWYGIVVTRNLDILLISQGYCNHVSPGLGDVYLDARAGTPPTSDASAAGSDSLNPALFSVAAEHETGDGDNYTAGQLDMFWQVCAYLSLYFDIPPEAFVHHREYTNTKPDMQFQGDARGAIAALLGTFAASHSTDALIQQASTKTHSTDALIQQASTKTHTTDASVLAVVEVTQSVDAHVQDSVTEVHATDALVLESFTGTHSADLVVLKSQLATHAADAYLVTETDATHETDAIVQDSFTATHATDVMVVDRTTANHSGDVVILQASSLGHGTDTLLLQSASASHSAQAVVQATSTPDHSTDAGLQKAVATSHNIDAYLVTEAAVTHETDAHVLDTLTVTHAADVLVVDRLTVDHGTDAHIQDTLEVGHAADAITRSTFSEAQSTDALVLKPQLAIHATDAFVSTAGTTTHATDAVVLKSQAEAHAGDAYLVDRLAADHVSDALLLKAQTVLHLTDAIFLSANLSSHTTDAVTSSATSVTHATDAVLLKAQVNAHTADALASAGTTATHAADAIVRRGQVAAHAADAIVLASNVEAHTSDALIEQARMVAHTVDVVLVAASTRTHTTDTLLEAAIPTVVHTTDAVIRGTRFLAMIVTELGSDQPTYNSSASMPVVRSKKPMMIISSEELNG